MFIENQWANREPSKEWLDFIINNKISKLIADLRQAILESKPN